MNEVNRTAYGVARIRAAESRRPSPLFVDPWAAPLSADATPRPAVGEAAQAQRRALVAHVILRTRFYDQLLLDAGLDQVVILGAGLDARAWRLPWPAGVTVWELDQEPALAHKATVLPAAEVDRRALVVDLRDDWPTALAAAGHDPERPTAWLAEGLLAYLDDTAARGLLADVSRLSAVGSVLGCERGTGRAVVAGTVSDLWLGGPTAGTDTVLRDLGWDVTVTDAADLAVRWDRPELVATTALVAAVRR